MRKFEDIKRLKAEPCKAFLDDVKRMRRNKHKYRKSPKNKKISWGEQQKL